MSQLFSRFFERGFSKFFIFPYCLLFGLEGDYLEQFEPESEKSSYQSYSDFFERKLKFPLKISSPEVWPCEGYFCDAGTFAEKRFSSVKGQVLDINDIFCSNPETTRNYFFVNIFLHNHNYHRVHAPTSGLISKITFIPGSLYFLRPWFYRKEDISFPAYKNERVIFEIIDQQKKPWYLTMVGGFGVGTVKIGKDITVGSALHAGQELAKFKLGSTVCLATPHTIEVGGYLEKIAAGVSMKKTGLEL